MEIRQPTQLTIPDRPGRAARLSSASAPSVVVVGAGPAGATTAHRLAERGARVELLEAHRLPRRKLCGGGLTPKAQALVPPSALAAVERRVDRTELRHPWSRPLALHYPEAAIAMVERERFDLALVEAAAVAGAVVRDATPVRGLGEDADGAWVVTDRGRLRADAVVLADGEPSRLARMAGLGSGALRRALALEADLPFAPDVSPDTAILSFDVRGGYAWYFPKADHANVGVGSYRERRAEPLRDALERFARSLGLGSQLEHARVGGHWIPQGLRQGPLATPRIVLAGDAAATADPLFGEGISYAIASGAAAAQTIGLFATGQIPDLRVHDGRLRQSLGQALRRLTQVARLAEASMTLALLGLRLSPAMREAAVDAIAGRATPFALDHDCALACLCRLGHESRRPAAALIAAAA